MEFKLPEEEFELVTETTNRKEKTDIDIVIRNR